MQQTAQESWNQKILPLILAYSMRHVTVKITCRNKHICLTHICMYYIFLLNVHIRTWKLDVKKAFFNMAL